MFPPSCEQEGRACSQNCGWSGSSVSHCCSARASIWKTASHADGNDDGTRPSSALNQAPTITGAPPASILEGELYEFTPNASDPDGDDLEFSISRKPEWADFNRATGRLSGTPGAGDVGNFTNIVISVSDGKAHVAARGLRHLGQPDCSRSGDAFLDAAD